MKNLYAFLLLLFLLFAISINAQDTLKTSKDEEILNLKIRLLDAKLELLDKKLLELEESPKLLKIKFNEIDSLVNLFEDLKKNNYKVLNDLKKEKTVNYVDTADKTFSSAIALNPYRLFEGTFAISYEKSIKEKMSFKASLMYTYVTKNGMGGGYFANQKFDETVYLDGNNYSYNGEMFTGLGLILSTQHYLKRYREEDNLLTGFYASPKLMYRRMWIIGKAYDYSLDVPVEKEVTRGLDIMRFGAAIGGKFSVYDVFFIDIYAGGVMRLSKYEDESKVTRYKRWNNIDYTGVLPVVGFNFGIFI